MPKYMMATKAIHQLGDISRDKPDICRIDTADEWNYFGAWVTGFGFFDVAFPRETTRELTDEEFNHYNGKLFRVASQPPIPLRIDR